MVKESPSLKEVATRLQAFMDAVGTNQKGIARAANVGETTVSQWMNGKQLPRVSNLEALAESLGMKSGPIVRFVLKDGPMPTIDIAETTVLSGPVVNAGSIIEPKERKAGVIIGKAREKAGLSMHALAKKTNTGKAPLLNEADIHSIEYGHRIPSAAEVVKIVRALGADTLEALEASLGIPNSQKTNHNGAKQGKVPHFESCAKVAAGWDGARHELQITAADADEWVVNLRPEHPDAFSITVEGDSMDPEIKHGERVMAASSAPVENGCFALCFGVEDNQCLLRQVEFSDDGEFVTLRPANPKYRTKTFQFRDSSIRLVRVIAQWTKR